MLIFVGKRLFQFCVSAYLVSIVLFSLQLILPSDPFAKLRNLDRPPAATELQRQLELDQPPAYATWIKSVLSGELGESAFTGKPVIELVGERLPTSAQLLAISLLTALVIGVPLGLYAGRREQVSDRSSPGFVLFALSVPNYVLSALFILVAWLLAGSPSELKQMAFIGGQNFTNLIMPAIVLALPPAATLMLRLNNHVRQTSAKPRFRDVALLALSGLALGGVALLSGLVVVEAIFAIEGLGKLAVEASVARDYPVLVSLALFATTVGLVLVLVADIASASVNPGRTKLASPERSTAQDFGPADVTGARRSTATLVGLVLVGLFVATSALGLWSSQRSEGLVSLAGSWQAPSAINWLGTDEVGRDVLSQLVEGTWLALFNGTMPVLVALLVGTVLGLCAGFVGRLGLLGSIADAVISAPIDAMLAIPFLVLALLLASLFTPEFNSIAVAVAIATIPGFARVTREHFLNNASAVGGWPGLLIKLAVQTMLAMAAAGIAYASVCLLGYGPPLPTPSWGALIGSSAWTFTQAPWIVLSAGLFVVLAALSFNLVAMGLRKALTTAPGQYSLPTAT